MTTAPVQTEESAAIDLWKSSAPPLYLGLLDHSDGWSFDESTQTYHDADGDPLTSADLKAIVIETCDGVGQMLGDIALEYFQGKKAFDRTKDFLKRFGGMVKSLYTALAGIAAGGIDLLTPRDTVTLAGSVEHGTGLSFALDRAKVFQRAIDDGEPRADSPTAVENRGEMYGQAAHATYETIRGDHHEEAGFTHERNVLGDVATKHCSECPALTESGWQPIGSMPEPGMRECSLGCHCHLAYSRDPEDETSKPRN